MRIQKSTDKEDFGRKGLFRADSIVPTLIYFIMNTTLQTQHLAEKYEALIAKNPNLRIRDAADALGCSEAELLFYTGQGKLLDTTPTACIQTFEKMGHVMSLTRNQSCVLEHKGTFKKVDIHGQVATVIGSIETRAFFHGWIHFFAVEFAKGNRQMRSIQVFDRFGDAVTKVYLLEDENPEAYNLLTSQVKSTDHFTVESGPEATTEEIPSDFDKQSFVDSWKKIGDPHDFFGMLRTYNIGRYSAMKVAEGACTYNFPTDAIPELLKRVAAESMPIMIFAGNRGNIQIHQDVIKQVVPLEQPNGKHWINVMDSEFNMHLRMDLLRDSWVVYKPSADGPVWSIECYDENQQLAVQFFGLRKPGIAQPTEWKALIDTFSNS
ncbi:MAG: hypothetical protein JJU02_05520 [Cryomorphaceae bacterium]|nr:hypothetical protein [Cryomorphaceae bacterium]